MITEITGISHIMTKQDMSRWTRAHANAPGINWSVFAGPGGTMIIVEHAEDRCTLNVSNVSAELALSAVDSPVDGAGMVRVSA